ncbi:ribosomal biogenesis regulatory protein [Aulographum hederae CBS 113979]|uniref:Ribosome biogenesis regulatory protein n=1 Tax=Aulographum hederae CBS 113979 TaxID=1176131 RepID=A0A6G1GUW2_9PEZI|nr:ribosomal biogenesis regulatory protein [Aulographum hederae CBS 113979]
MEDADSTETTSRPSIHVTKPTPYTFDLGNLLANDPNPIPSSLTEATLTALARDSAQALLNQLLTTCPIRTSDDGTLLTLPAPSTPLPREKPLPAAKEPTKWELFAAKKGIKAKRRDEGGGKKVYDEESGEWVRKWGYKGKNKDGEGDWLVEVDAKKHTTKEGEEGNVRAMGRTERMERIKRNERKMRKNELRASKMGA